MRTIEACTILAALALLTPSAAGPAYAGMTHSWTGEGDALDSVGDDDGTLVGDTAFGPGFIGQGFVFDGAGDAVTFGSDVGNFGTADFSVAFAVSMDSLTSLDSLDIMSKRTICGFHSFWDIRTGNGTVGFEIRDLASSTGTGSVVSLADGEFHTVVFTRAGTVVSAYIDGIRRSRNDSAVTSNVTNASPLIFGTGPCVGFDGTVQFIGSLDEIRFADTAEPYLLLGDFDCGDAALNGGVSAPDALVTLRTAVGTSECPPCVCDVNAAGGITASDAQAILRFGVGQPVSLGCPDCEF